MKNPLVITAVVAVVVAAACIGGTWFAMSSAQKSLQAELETCRAEQVEADAQVIAWEQRFDRESERWEGMEANILEQVPQAVNELQTERDRIIELVPEQVQEEVTKYLDDYFATVMTGFEAMAQDSQQIRMKLGVTNQVLANLGADTTSLRQSVEGQLTEELDKRDAERAQREDVAQQIGQLVSLVKEFDTNRINCKQCPDKLRLKRKEREAITAFHSELSVKLSGLQAAVAK